jgi:Major Facilitator Superfamily
MLRFGAKHERTAWREDSGSMPQKDPMHSPTVTPPVTAQPRFYGTTVVRAAFVLALFGWGIGFYSPSIFLHAVTARTGWTVPMVSAAATFHFMFGALLVARLPSLHARWGLPQVTGAGATALALGTIGWAMAAQPWQLFLAAAFSGAGWVTMGAAAINAILSPWFVHFRPMALAKAYNGASVGGVVFSPLWVVLIAQWGFPVAAGLVGAAMLGVVAWIAARVLTQSPQQRGESPDGDAPGTPARSITSARAQPLAGAKLWRDRGFVTLAAAMALSLFAQAGLLAHLYTLLAAAWGTIAAGWAMALVTACAVGGRTLVARCMPIAADRRLVASASIAVQVAGSLLLWVAPIQHGALLLLGVLLFGAGIGNATSMPPLVAQLEFVPEDVGRVVALIVALSQALWALAPLAFGLLLTAGTNAHPGVATSWFFGTAALMQLAAIACMLAGRIR